MNNNNKCSQIIEQVNEFTEITITRTDDEYEWYWRCKESETAFKTPELALLDAINFICRDYEALLVATLTKDEDVDE